MKVLIRAQRVLIRVLGAAATVLLALVVVLLVRRVRRSVRYNEVKRYAERLARGVAETAREKVKDVAGDLAQMERDLAGDLAQMERDVAETASDRIDRWARIGTSPAPTTEDLLADAGPSRRRRLRDSVIRAYHSARRRAGSEKAKDVAANGGAAADTPPTAPVSFAQLDAPGAVVVGEEFEVDIGLAPEPSRGVSEAQPVELPPGTPSEYTLTIHVTAIGFTIRDDEKWLQKLLVDWADQQYPTKTIHLTAEPLPDNVEAEGQSIKATYEIGGDTVAMATRPVAVLAQATMPVPELPEHRSRDVTLPTSDVPPDLTVHLFRGRGAGQLWMTLGSRWDIDLPDEEVEIDIGAEPDKFARQLVDTMNAAEGQPALWNELLGRGRAIGKVLRGRNQNDEFWNALDAAITKLHEDPARADDIPTLLVLSEEPYVPWELAAVQAPPFTEGEEPFLASQVAIGRWPLDKSLLPPPHEKTVGTMAVVTGDYKDIPFWNPLPHAVAEGNELGTRYRAASIDATFVKVRDVIEGDPARDVLHIAIHGKYDQDSIVNGLILIDRDTNQPFILTPDGINGMTMPGRPFVFLNACQVGNGMEVLGLYGGVAAAFLERGASGVIAPSWNVKDTVAKDAALDFYEDVFSGTGVGEAVRRMRAQFAENADTSTFMAYQYFGHPALQLIKQ